MGAYNTYVSDYSNKDAFMKKTFNFSLKSYESLS